MNFVYILSLILSIEFVCFVLLCFNLRKKIKNLESAVTTQELSIEIFRKEYEEFSNSVGQFTLLTSSLFEKLFKNAKSSEDSESKNENTSKKLN